MNNFKIDFVSDTKREHLAVEIYYQNQRLCQINKELGDDRMEIEFITDLYKLPQEVVMTFPLADFEAVILEAKVALKAR